MSSSMGHWPIAEAWGVPPPTVRPGASAQPPPLALPRGPGKARNPLEGCGLVSLLWAEAGPAGIRNDLEYSGTEIKTSLPHTNTLKHLFIFVSLKQR